jgi:hypothetical protein
VGQRRVSCDESGASCSQPWLLRPTGSKDAEPERSTASQSATREEPPGHRDRSYTDHLETRSPHDNRPSQPLAIPATILRSTAFVEPDAGPRWSWPATYPWDRED